MKFLLSCSCAAAFLVLLTFSAFAQTVSLSNEDIVSLSKSGLSADIVVAKIKATPAKFDTSTEQLKSLKDGGVPESVILAMVQFPLGADSVVSEAKDEIV